MTGILILDIILVVTAVLIAVTSFVLLTYPFYKTMLSAYKLITRGRK